MYLFMPTLVYSEKDCVKNHFREIALTGEKAMIVTGKHSSRKNGSLDDVSAVLNQENISYIIFDDIEENPSVETVMRARELAVSENVDFIIGIGGGSPLDAAKAIALMAANPEANEEVLYQSNALPYLPIICIPTTCGTGSEVTPYSILTLHKQKTKKSISHKIFPTLALLDTKYLKTANRSCIVNTSVDALAHLIESYLNTNSNSLNRIYSEQGLRMWAEFKDNLKNDTLSEKDYERMLHTSMVAGIAITHTGTSLPHGLSYAVTYELGVPHGKAVGMFLGGYVDNYKDKNETGKVLELLGFSNAKEIRCYLNELLGKTELSPELLSANADSILANKGKLKNYPFKITKEELINMPN
ncbi:MAG: iron-containing alcohol dehydrogenase [Lachnospiraceae bacterium]